MVFNLTVRDSQRDGIYINDTVDSGYGNFNTFQHD
jgi:hypothetical protein